jgi:hypothetical protein
LSDSQLNGCGKIMDYEKVEVAGDESTVNCHSSSSSAHGSRHGATYQAGGEYNWGEDTAFSLDDELLSRHMCTSDVPGEWVNNILKAVFIRNVVSR